MNRRKELVEQYKEVKIEAGVYCIRHKKTGKLFISSTPNLKSLNGKRFELNMGSSRNAALQADWSRDGEDAFEIDVLEVLKKPESGYFDAKDALEKLEKAWLDRLQPYGDKGYM
ncbi:GIY-YIG nuclease family protein [Paenibacillus enshidis]|uniref:GIY-YIG nuclease family protein n=1 Tax=Paenibacillus enshidis TaxID=1458439 RepID=A0ABV5AUM6_9BACL